MPSIDFRKIREHNNSRNEGFEELCCQIYSHLSPQEKSRWTRKSGAGGDGGVEGYWTLPSGEEHCLQAKYFFELESSQRQQITSSVKSMMEKHPRCTKYIICLPIDLGEARQGKKWSQRRHWNSLVVGWKQIDPPRHIEFELWDASRLSTFLSRDDAEFSGRRHYWFNEKFLSRDWFSQRANEAIANLGPRYTPEYHVDLPLEKKLSAIARDNSFWLDLAELPEPPQTHTDDESLKALQTLLRAEVITANDLVAEACRHRKIDDVLADAKTHFAIAAKTAEDFDAKDDVRRAWSELLFRTREAASHLEENNVQLSRDKVIAILGQAGVGKSHLLADVTAQAIREGRPAVLLLGQQLKSGQSISFITSSLDIEGGVDNFLGALDAAAQSKRCRALLCIDALNEGAGVTIWPDELAGLLKRIEPYPNIVTVLSCRDTYQRIIFRNVADDDVSVLWHQGFAGHEDAAAKSYLDRKGISRPDAPFLDPEFSNPLFLKTICEALERRKEHRFPKGLRGVTKIFDFYMAAVCDAIELRLDLDRGQKLVRRAIQKLIDAFVEADEDHIANDAAYAIAEGVLASGGSRERSLLHQLKSEGLFSQDRVYSSEDDTEGQEVIRFSYERYLDHFRASRFIERNVDAERLDSAFEAGGPFDRYLADKAWRYRGVINALAIQVPEKFDRELLPLVELPDDDSFHWLKRTLPEATKLSILHRDPEKCSEETLRVLNEHLGGLGDTAFELSVRCCIEPAHLFNGELLNKNLIRLKMYERDQSWTRWCVSQWEAYGDRSSAVNTLIDWAFNVDPESVDDERLFLALKTLCWFFTSPRRSLRDRATKAASAILGKRIQIARRLVLEFDGVDDFYVLERVYAIAYACALRVGSKEIAPLARTVINRAYRSEQNYDHVLLREYAFGIVELARRHGSLPSHVPEKAQSFIQRKTDPIEFPTVAEIESLKDDLRSVYGSVMAGDFGTYVMNDVFHFSCTPFAQGEPQTFNEVKQRFLEDLETENPGAAEAIVEYQGAQFEEEEHASNKRSRKYGQTTTMSFDLSSDPPRYVELPIPEYDAEAHDRAKERLNTAKATFDELVSKENQEHWRWLSGSKGDSDAIFSRRKAKRWVIKRVSELGWTKDRFESFERSFSRGYGRNDHDQERMGKKYQWIAYHELLAKLIDRYPYLQKYSFDPSKLQGAWQLGRRDIDPTLMHPGDLKKAPTETCWWLQGLPDVSQAIQKEDIHAWIRETSDLPPAHSGTGCEDPEGNEFVILESYHSARERRTRYGENYRSFSASVHSVILRSADVHRMLRALRNKSFPGVFSNPQEWSGYAFIDEYDWHPSWESTDEVFRKLSGLNSVAGAPDVHYPYRQYMCEHSSYNKSISQTISINLPSKFLIEGLNLSFEARKMSFIDGDGVVFADPAAFKDTSPAALANKSVFGRWLQANDFVVASAITYRKNYYNRDPEEFLGELADCQLSFWNGISRWGERWTLLDEVGDRDQILRTAKAI